MCCALCIVLTASSHMILAVNLFPAKCHFSVFQFSGIAVQRRYKHFDWLLGRFQEKYPTIVIPPLPDKQISGKSNLKIA